MTKVFDACHSRFLEVRKRARSWKLFRKLWHTPWHMTDVQMAESNSHRNETIYVTSQNLVQGISVGQKIQSCCPKSKGWDWFWAAFIIGKKKEIEMEWKDGAKAKAEEIWGERSNRGRRWWAGIAGTVGTVVPGPALGHQTPPGHGCSSQHSSPQLWHAESHTQLPSGASPSPHPKHSSHICFLCSSPRPALSSLPVAPAP